MEEKPTNKPGSSGHSPGWSGCFSAERGAEKQPMSLKKAVSHNVM